MAVGVFRSLSVGDDGEDTGGQRSGDGRIRITAVARESAGLITTSFNLQNMIL